jgi:hypothetical protein
MRTQWGILFGRELALEGELASGGVYGGRLRPEEWWKEGGWIKRVEEKKPPQVDRLDANKKKMVGWLANCGDGEMSCPRRPLSTVCSSLGAV